MFCYFCGFLTDWAMSGLCPHCQKEVERINERNYHLGLLRQALVYCPMPLYEKIEEALGRYEQPFISTDL